MGWVRHRFRHWWLPAGYWRQKRREFSCWLKHGHEWTVLGGAGGWEVRECRRCGAKRVGPLAFFQARWSDPEPPPTNPPSEDCTCPFEEFLADPVCPVHGGQR